MNKLTLALYILVILVLVYEIVTTTTTTDIDTSSMLPSSPPGQYKSITTTPVVQEQAGPVVASSRTEAPGSSRELNPYRDITADASSFDINEANEKAKRAYESDVIITYADAPAPVAGPRTSTSMPGSSDTIITNITGGTPVRPIVDNVLPAAPSPAPAPINTGTIERSDHRCGPAFGGAKCGTGRCCSIYGWCGSPGEPHCLRGVNMPAYNGPSGSLPNGMSNGTVVKCSTGEIYKIENDQKRLYPTLSIYEKYGSPAFINSDCAALNNVIPGIPFN